jgi:hypothetical protein
MYAPLLMYGFDATSPPSENWRIPKVLGASTHAKA